MLGSPGPTEAAGGWRWSQGGCSSAPTLLQGEPRVLHVKGKAKQGKESLLETRALMRQCLKTGTKPKGRFKDR